MFATCYVTVSAEKSGSRQADLLMVEGVINQSNNHTAQADRARRRACSSSRVEGKSRAVTDLVRKHGRAIKPERSVQVSSTSRDAFGECVQDW